MTWELSSTTSHGMITTMIQFVSHPPESLILVDSNILIYSLSSRSTKCLRAQDFLQKNQQILCIAQQNIFETLRVLTHPNTPNPLSAAEAIKDITLVTEHLQVLSPLPETEYIATELIQKHNVIGSKIFDAYLAATALSHGVTTIATENEKDFKMFEGISILNPFQIK